MKCKIIVWGSGVKAIRFIEFCISEVLFVVDSNTDKCGENIKGISIRRPEQIIGVDYDYIVICSSFYREIVKTIRTIVPDIDNEKIVVAVSDSYFSIEDYKRSPLCNLIKEELYVEYEREVRDQLYIRVAEMIKKDIESENILECGLERKSMYDKKMYGWEVASSIIWNAVLEKKKGRISVVLKNKFGFMNYLDTGLSLPFVLENDYASDSFLFCRYISDHYSHFGTVIDIGGNRGIVSCFFARISDVVHVFEPSKRISEVAQKNIELNGFKNIVWNICGIGASNEERQFYDYGIKQSGHNSYIEQEDILDQTYITRVVTLDEYCEKNNIDKIDIVKIDVEGFEPDVIKGMKKLLENKRISIIILEVSPTINRNISAHDEMYAELKNYGYDFYDVTGECLLLDAIHDIKTDQDIICISKGETV